MYVMYVMYVTCKPASMMKEYCAVVAMTSKVKAARIQGPPTATHTATSPLAALWVGVGRIIFDHQCGPWSPWHPAPGAQLVPNVMNVIYISI